MTSVIIDDTLPYTQSIATGSQTVFNANWTADVASDVVVYARATGVAPNDVTQIVSSINYTVTFIGAEEYVRVTFLSGRTAGDVITITRNTPADRMNLYTNTNFTPSMLNGDFGRQVMMIQQNLLHWSQLMPRYNTSATVQPVIDMILPILPAGTTWVKNNADTAIIAAAFPEDGAASKIDTYVTMTDETANEPNSFPLSTINSGIMVNRTGTTDIVTRTLTGTSGQIGFDNDNGVSGNPTAYIVDNPVLPGTAGMGIPQGTTAQRVTPLSGIGLRFNTNLGQVEYWSGSAWVQLNSSDLSLYLLLAGGTMTGVINMGNNFITNVTDPVNPQDAATRAYVDAQVGGVTTLTDGHIFVGNAANVATDVAMSGDATIANTGVITVSKIGGVDISLAGAFITLGAFDVDFTFTGNTAVTFPTSGTLATTSQLLVSPLTTKGDLWGFSTTNDRLAVGGTNGQILQVNSAAAMGLSYSTATYPSTTTINQLLYSSANNVVAGLATVNDSVLTTSALGVPTWALLTGFANAPTNTNITSMTGLTGALQAPTTISSSAGAILIAFGYTASAVNYFSLTNNITGQTPALDSNGSDASVGLALRAKNAFVSISDNTNTIATPLRFYNATGNYSALKAPTGATDVTWVLPATDGNLNYPLRTNGAGILSFTLTPTVSAYDSGGTTLAANTFTKINLATENWDIGNYFTGSTYTPPAGIYQVTVSMDLSSVNLVNGTAYFPAIYKNGAVYAQGTVNPVVGTRLRSNVAALVNMNGADTLEFYGFNGNAATTVATLANSAVTYFNAVWVAPLT